MGGVFMHFFFLSILLCLRTITTIRPHTHIFHLDSPTSQQRLLYWLLNNDSWRFYYNSRPTGLTTTNSTGMSSHFFSFFTNDYFQIDHRLDNKQTAAATTIQGLETQMCLEPQICIFLYKKIY